MDKKLDKFVEELQKQYVMALEDYMMSSMFSSGAHIRKIEVLEEIVDSLNRIWKTSYCLEKPKQYEGITF